MAIDKTQTGTGNVHWQRHGEALRAKEDAELQLSGIDSQIATLEGRIRETQGRVDQILGKASSAERKAKAAEVRETVGSGLMRAAANFGRQLAKLAGVLGKSEYTVTVTDLEKDPTADKTAEKVRTAAEDPNLAGYRDQIASWTASLETLAAQRTAAAETLANHSAAVVNELRLAQEHDAKTSAGLDAVESATEQAAHLDAEPQVPVRTAIFSLFSGLVSEFVDIFRPDPNASIAEKVADKVSGAASAVKPNGGEAAAPEPAAASAQREPGLFAYDPNASIAEKVAGWFDRLLGQTPVPVPVDADVVQAAGGDPQTATQVSPDQVVAPRKKKLSAEETGLPVYDARSLFQLPDPKTGREWVSMVAGLDYRAIHNRSHLAREYDAALKSMRVPIRHQGQPVKDVKRNITRLYGLREKDTAIEVRREVNRRMAAGVDRWTNKAAFDQHLAKLGLPSDASASDICAAVRGPAEPKVDPADARKSALVAGLNAKSPMDAVRSALNQTEALDGKPGHSQNAASVALSFLADKTFASEVGNVDENGILSAVEWLNLGDLNAPASVLSAPRKLTDEEFLAYVKPRPQNAAKAFMEYGLGDEQTAELIRTHRAGDRSTSAMLVDIFDQLAALGAKPFFQKDGAPDVEKIGGAFTSNAAKAGVPGEIINAVVGGLNRGLLGEALQTRSEDLYVR